MQPMSTLIHTILQNLCDEELSQTVFMANLSQSSERPGIADHTAYKTTRT